MTMCYDGALVMPCNYAVINEEEMMYLNGGETYNLWYDKKYCSKVGAAVQATCVLIKTGWSPLLLYDFAAEIFCHAIAYYSVKKFLNICSSLGYSTSKVKNSDFYKSLNNGIDLENHVDKNTICGVPRYIFFRGIYAAAI